MNFFVYRIDSGTVLANRKHSWEDLKKDNKKSVDKLTPIESVELEQEEIEEKPRPPKKKEQPKKVKKPLPVRPKIP